MSSKAKDVQTAAQASTAAPAGSGKVFVPKRKKLLAVPLFRFHDDVPLFVKITSKFHAGQAPTEGRGKQKDPPMIADVVNLETGEQGQIVVASSYLPAFRVQEVIENAHPNGAYVGKSFEIMRKSKAEDQRYNDYVVAELEE